MQKILLNLYVTEIVGYPITLLVLIKMEGVF